MNKEELKYLRLLESYIEFLEQDLTLLSKIHEDLASEKLKNNDKTSSMYYRGKSIAFKDVTRRLQLINARVYADIGKEDNSREEW